MKVFKYPIAITDHQQIMMPKGANLLHVGEDPTGQLCVWAKVDVRKDDRSVNIWVAGTGHDAPTLGAHLGTVNINRFVWHIFWSRKI